MLLFVSTIALMHRIWLYILHSTMALLHSTAHYNRSSSLTLTFYIPEFTHLYPTLEGLYLLDFIAGRSHPLESGRAIIEQVWV